MNNTPPITMSSSEILIEENPWIEPYLLNEGFVGSFFKKILKGLFIGAAAGVISLVFIHSVNKYGWIKAIGGIAIFKVILDSMKDTDKKRLEKIRKLAKKDRVIDDVMKNGLSMHGFKPGYRIKFEQRLMELLPKQEYDEILAMGDRISRHAKQTIQKESINKKSYTQLITEIKNIEKKNEICTKRIY